MKEIGILKNYLRIWVLKIKLWKLETWKLFKNGNFENWNFGKLFEIKFKNWNFEELLKMKILKIDEVSQVCGITWGVVQEWDWEV